MFISKKLSTPWFLKMGACFAALVMVITIHSCTSNAGYDWPVFLSSTWLSIQLLLTGIAWTMLLQTIAIIACWITIHWTREIRALLQILFQLVSSVPLFIFCLYLSSFGLGSNLCWAGLALALGDFMLAQVFPLLHRHLSLHFHAAYREALQSRGIFFPIPNAVFSWQHWRVFGKYYVIPYLRELLYIIESKISLFFSAIIVIEKALFYGSNIEGANRGLGSLFFDCILEWSEGKNRAWIVLQLTLWSWLLVAVFQMICQFLRYLLQHQAIQTIRFSETCTNATNALSE